MNLHRATEAVSRTTERLRDTPLLRGPRNSFEVPPAPTTHEARSRSEISDSLPREGDYLLGRAEPKVRALGWAGTVYPVNSQDQVALFVHVWPKSRRQRRFDLAHDIASALVDWDGNDTSPVAVDLHDPAGRLLLRSRPKRGDRSEVAVREITFGDGSPCSTIIRTRGDSLRWKGEPAPELATTPLLADPVELDASADAGPARLWRGAETLASVDVVKGGRTLTIGPLTSDSEALLVWGTALAWWGRA